MHKQEELLRDLELEFARDLAASEKVAQKAKTQAEVKAELAKLAQKYTGKSSTLNSFLRGLKDIKDLDLRKHLGEQANKLQHEFSQKIVASSEKVATVLIRQQLLTEAVDPTRPGILPGAVGHQHLISNTIAEIEDIFATMGFSVEYPFEVDNEFNNFDALNIQASHPARDNWDTLWLSDGNLAITHTSSMQNRILRSPELPIRKIIIGKCFRNEATDARHEHTFFQCEGVYLDRRATIGEMVGVLLEFFEAYFGRKLKYKFTPDFFPFVEPGGQMAIECVICDGTGTLKSGDKCRVCKGSGFLEVLGCGMIHPKVLTAAGKDPNGYAGFAWGFGVERLAMIKYQINDLRYFHSGDLRFISQFS